MGTPVNGRYFLPATRIVHELPELWNSSKVHAQLLGGYPENLKAKTWSEIGGLEPRGIDPVELGHKAHADDGVLLRFEAADFHFEIPWPPDDPLRELLLSGYLISIELEPGRPAPLVFIMPSVWPTQIGSSTGLVVQAPLGGMIVLNSGPACVWCHRPLGPIESIEGAS